MAALATVGSEKSPLAIQAKLIGPKRHMVRTAWCPGGSGRERHTKVSGDESVYGRGLDLESRISRSRRSPKAQTSRNSIGDGVA